MCYESARQYAIEYREQNRRTKIARNTCFACSGCSGASFFATVATLVKLLQFSVEQGSKSRFSVASVMRSACLVNGRADRESAGDTGDRTDIVMMLIAYENYVAFCQPGH